MADDTPVSCLKQLGLIRFDPSYVPMGMDAAAAGVGPMTAMDHRTLAYSLLAGDGLEIGALHNPAQVPPCCHVFYGDAMSEAEARRSFPELTHVPLAPVSHIVNLDLDALTAFDDASQDFVILNHVIEHVANPIRVIVECFRVLRDGGKLVMSAPDMRFSFDRGRALTTSAHLWAEYDAGVTTVTDEHYADFLNVVHADRVKQATQAEFERGLAEARDRREHAHVWNSDTFRALLLAVVQRQHIEAHLLVESTGDDNASEYFSVWQKGPLPSASAPVYLNPAHTVVAFNHVLHQVNVARQDWAERHAALQTVVHNLQTDAQRLQAELTRSQHTIADKDRHIQNVEAQLSVAVREHQHTIEAIRSSRAWRWTAWLRR